MASDKWTHLALALDTDADGGRRLGIYSDGEFITEFNMGGNGEMVTEDMEKAAGEKWVNTLRGVSADNVLKQLAAENDTFVTAREKLSEAKIEHREADRRASSASAATQSAETALKTSRARVTLLMENLQSSLRS